MAFPKKVPFRNASSVSTLGGTVQLKHESTLSQNALNDDAGTRSKLKMQSAISAKGIDAHFYLSKDAPRAIAFYSALLGTAPARGNDQYAEFDLGDHSTFGISMAPTDGWQPAGGVMFAFDDVEGALARAVELGATVALKEDSATCTTAWCFDRDGNTFALHHRKS